MTGKFSLNNKPLHQTISRVAKRLVDIVGSLVALILLAPLFLAIMVAVLFFLGRPIFFTQIRPGIHGKPFRMFKFRSMRELRDTEDHMLPDAFRLTHFGRHLRASSLDELPELWNVLKGDMSLVGPRPLLTEYLSLYSPEQARRNEVRPGITGWAQINGRNQIDWDEKFKLDVWYVDNHNLRLDLRILWCTIRKVIEREGISAPGDTTMPMFTGNNSTKIN